MYNEVLEKVIKVLSVVTSNDAITEDNELLEDLDIDSMNLLMILSSMEAEFGVHIDENETSKMFTVKDIAEIISVAARKDFLD